MKKRFWKIEYSITIFVIFAIILMLIPTRFISSKEASYIAKWNEYFHKMEYIFSAMNAQVDSNIVKGFKNAKTNQDRENLMMQLVKPYLRLREDDNLSKKYNYQFMNGNKVSKDEFYYFDSLYYSESGKIVGIKDIKDDDIYHPAFIMMFDVNGLKGPNTWGRDVFGVNIFVDGKISPIGAGNTIEELQQDCSQEGTGVTCSYYYRIGGEFNE